MPQISIPKELHGLFQDIHKDPKTGETVFPERATEEQIRIYWEWREHVKFFLENGPTIMEERPSVFTPKTCRRFYEGRVVSPGAREAVEEDLAAAEPYPEDDPIWDRPEEERDRDRVDATIAKIILETARDE